MDWQHKPPGAESPFPMSTNVMPDLATAMKYNPQMHVLLAGGYYDLATPFFAAEYEMHHLPIPARLQANIEYAFYPSGHMVYAHEASLKSCTTMSLHSLRAATISRIDRPPAAGQALVCLGNLCTAWRRCHPMGLLARQGASVKAGWLPVEPAQRRIAGRPSGPTY